jgi:hypothetical protein
MSRDRLTKSPDGCKEREPPQSHHEVARAAFKGGGGRVPATVCATPEETMIDSATKRCQPPLAVVICVRRIAQPSPLSNIEVGL